MRATWMVVAAASGAVLAVSGPRPAAAQTGFEGVITYATHEDRATPGTMTITTKGSKMRMEQGDPGSSLGAFVIDNDAHTSTIIMHQQKQYMTYSADQPMPGMRGMSKKPDDADDSHMTITKTGRTETVAGVSCDVYHWTSTREGKSGEGDACVAKGVGLQPFALMGPAARANGALSPQLAAMRDALKDGRGVLKVTEIKDGTPTVVLEATKIEQKPIPDATFQPPPDYTQFQMPQMRKPS